jgi:ABC-type uncharacterized transport system YnjBCD substrate-binding protein
MRCKEADVLMICKGHYNQEKHKSTFDALIAYHAQWSGLDPKFLDEGSLIQVMLRPAAKKYFRAQDWDDVYTAICDREEFWSRLPKENWKSTVLIIRLDLLQVREGDHYIIEDMRYYENDENII